MRDCPACKVPLHGYEDVCPSCGTQQYPTKSSRTPYGTAFKPAEPGVNWTPFIVAFVIGGILLVMAIQGTWIGQVLRGENKLPDDPLAQMSTMDARSMVETELNKNLESAGGSNTKLDWKLSGAEDPAAAADARSADQTVELAVTTSLPDKSLIPQVVEPVKPYLEKAKIHTLTVVDTASRATRTYNVQVPTSVPDDEAAGE